MTEPRLTGRIDAGPSALLDEEILAPQFRFEVTHLLRDYVLIERAQLLEYLRMAVLSEQDVAAIDAVLRRVPGTALFPEPEGNFSDITFALERHVQANLAAPVPLWHVDRGRNDAQATAQVMFGRQLLLRATHDTIALATVVAARADSLVDLPMPGYTHLQAAQVISPGFYLAALGDQALCAVDRLLAAYHDVNLCPLGAGAMAGQRLPWDRDRLAALLGFRAPQRHALVAVASRAWAVTMTTELSACAAVLSRFVTDLMAWSGAGYGFVELPDRLAGISSVMPQKKNYPVFERIRGRCAHVTGLAHDLVQALHRTPYANSVEVGKEATRFLADTFAAFGSAVRLLTTVVAELRFRPDTTRSAADGAFLGALALADLLSLRCGLPWRTAQVVVGRYVSGSSPDRPEPGLLADLCALAGHSIADSPALLDAAFDLDHALSGYVSDGSANPDSVRALLAAQRHRIDELTARTTEHERCIMAGAQELDRSLNACAEQA